MNEIIWILKMDVNMEFPFKHFFDKFIIVRFNKLIIVRFNKFNFHLNIKSTDVLDNIIKT